VAVTSPSALDLLAGQVTLAARTAGSATGVQFQAGGSAVGPELTQSPYQVRLDTTTLADGLTTITAVVRDASGRTALSAGVDVVLANVSGVVSGQIEAQVAVQFGGPQQAADLARQLGIHPRAEFVPGEALVKFRETRPAATPFGALQVVPAAEIAGGYALVRRTSDRLEALAAGPDLATLELIAELRAHPDVIHAEPNYLRRPAGSPGDPLLAQQWGLEQINLPSAWTETTGGEQVVVAVLDTGILFRHGDPAASHPDFDPARILPGYDFVSSVANAGDGTSRDPDPYDDGSLATTAFHGTHVAGTVAAWTANGVGIAGVDWSARLLPVRVLGLYGGTVADIADGIRWAAGLSVPGAPPNPHPADVINLSLGGYGISLVEQEAIDAAVATGAIVVAAAGNASDDARYYSPAGLNGVITVGATGPSGDLAYYSNHGPAIDVLAPGGEQLYGQTAGGVLSASRDAAGNFTYAYYQGTSMAAPHVSGTIALMKALDASLDHHRALAYLRATARPVHTGACSAGCGAGIVDAQGALLQVRDAAPVGAMLARTLHLAQLGSSGTTAAFELANAGDRTLTWSAASSDHRIWLSAASGSLAPETSAQLTLQLDRDGIPDGTYLATIDITGNAGNTATVLVTFVQGTGISDLGTLKVFLWDPATGQNRYVVETTHDDLYRFLIAGVTPGTYGLDAADADPTLGAVNHYGYYGQVSVEAGERAGDLSVRLSEPSLINGARLAAGR
jgi:serine protease